MEQEKMTIQMTKEGGITLLLLAAAELCRFYNIQIESFFIEYSTLLPIARGRSKKGARLPEKEQEELLKEVHAVLIDLLQNN